MNPARSPSTGLQPAQQSLRAVMELRDLVLRGDIPPGQRLYEVQVATQVGMSRTPVREAMTQLAQEGLLERKPTGGFIVRSFSFQDVIDAIELRGVMEGTAARLAAERGADADLMTHWREVVSGMDDAVPGEPDDIDFDLYVDLNAEFHRLLALLPGSQLVQRELERAARLPFASPSAFLREQANTPAFRRSLRGGQEQHRSLVEAVTLREGARAEAIAREHARLARRNLESIMKQDRRLISRVPGLALIRV